MHNMNDATTGTKRGLGTEASRVSSRQKGYKSTHCRRTSKGGESGDEAQHPALALTRNACLVLCSARRSSTGRIPPRRRCQKFAAFEASVVHVLLLLFLLL
jgi:hypothetical protein